MSLLNLDGKAVRSLSSPVSDFTLPANQSPLVALLSIAKSIRAFYGMRLAAMGFHNGQDELLLIACDTGVTVSSMADQLMVRPSTVSKMLDRLEAKSLIKRVGDIRDARRTVVQITPTGIEAQSLLIKMREEVDAELNKALKAASSANAGNDQTALDGLNEWSAMLIRQLRRVR